MLQSWEFCLNIDFYSRDEHSIFSSALPTSEFSRFPSTWYSNYYIYNGYHCFYNILRRSSYFLYNKSREKIWLCVLVFIASKRDEHKNYLLFGKFDWKKVLWRIKWDFVYAEKIVQIWDIYLFYIYIGFIYIALGIH